MHDQGRKFPRLPIIVCSACLFILLVASPPLRASEPEQEPEQTTAETDAELHAQAKEAIEAERHADAARLILRISYPYRRDNGLLQYPAMLGATPPRARVQPLINTLIGGTGRQVLHTLTISDDLILVGKGEGWSVTYDLNDPRPRPVVEGDIDTDDTNMRRASGPRPPIDWKKEWPNAPRFLDIRNGHTVRYMTWQNHNILQQPFVESTADWTMWGWWFSLCEQHSLMADSRCYKVWPIANGKYGALVWTDGGNTSLARHPQHVNRGIRVGGVGFGRGPRLAFAVVNPENGTIENMTAYFGNPPFFAIDPWGRMVMGGDFTRRAAVTVLSNRDLSVDVKMGIAGHRWGETPPSDPAGQRRHPNTRVHAFVLHDNIVAVGGITMARSIQGARNFVQQRAGGDGDAFLFVGRLW